VSNLAATLRDLRLSGRVPSSPQGVALLAAGVIILEVCGGADGVFTELLNQLKKLIEQAPGPGTPAAVLEMVRHGLRSLLVLSVVYCVAVLGLAYVHNGFACSFRIARGEPASLGVAARTLGSFAVVGASAVFAVLLAIRLVSQGARLYGASPETWRAGAGGLIVRHLTFAGFVTLCVGGGCVGAAWFFFIRKALRRQSAGGGEG
jgi:hypothetical protein